MVKLFSCKAHDGDYFWLRYKHDEEKLYHNLVIDGGRKSNASDFYEMLKHICKNGEQIDAMVLTHFDQDHIMGMFAGLQNVQAALELRLNCGGRAGHARQFHAEGSVMKRLLTRGALLLLLCALPAASGFADVKAEAVCQQDVLFCTDEGHGTSFGSLFGCDKDNAIGSTYTING